MRGFNSSDYWICVVCTFSNVFSSGTFDMERSPSSHLVSKPCTLSFSNWTLKKVVDVKNSFACSADLEITKRVMQGNLFSLQETIVLLCLLLFHVSSKSAVSNFLSALTIFESSSSKSRNFRPRTELDDFHRPYFLAESTSLSHTIPFC